MTDEDPGAVFVLTDMDTVRSAIFNALHSGLSLQDVAEASRHAADADDFDAAICMLGIHAIDPLGSILKGQANG